MKLGELLGPEGLVVGFNPPDKWQGISDLVQILVDRGRLTAAQAEPALEAVLRRERSMSTGMERGIAIPHAALDGIAEPLACLGITAPGQGVPFESMDGAPAELVVLLLIPKAQKLVHIRTLADVARVLGNAEVRSRLGQAADEQQAFEVLQSAS
ncbi:MAG: PTS sugar transporter subunit IIA [Planctomycetota bacterium]